MIHVIRLIDLIRVSKTLPQMQVEAIFLEGREEVHTGDTLPRAFRFLGRIKTSPNEHVLHKYPHEQPQNQK